MTGARRRSANQFRLRPRFKQLEHWHELQYFRQSDKRKLVKEICMLSNAADAVSSKMKSMKAGDVLTIGADQKPRFLADRTTSEFSKDSSKVRRLGNVLNLK